MVSLRNKLRGDAAEKLAQVMIQLLHLEQKPVMAVFGNDLRERRVWDTPLQLLLLGKGEKHVRLDPEDQRGLLNQAQCFPDHLLGGCIESHAVSGNIVGVQFVSQGYVAVGVESFVELFTLILQIRLCTSVSGRLGEGWLLRWFGNPVVVRVGGLLFRTSKSSLEGHTAAVGEHRGHPGCGKSSHRRLCRLAR